MLANTAKALLLTLVLTSSALAHVERVTCTGAAQDGYCCDGSIIPVDHSSNTDASHWICCQGDPHIQVVNGPSAPTSCTAGTQIPLTQLGSASATSGSGGSSSTSAAASSASSTVSSAISAASSAVSSAVSPSNNAARAMITNAPLVGVAAIASGLLLGL